MRILRGARLADVTDPRFSTGTPEQRQEARREWHRERFIAQVASSDLEEIPRADLTDLWFGLLEHVKTGRLYRRRRDWPVDLAYTNAVAYYLDISGFPILLEPAPGPKTRAELEAKRAEREERRNTPKPPRVRR